MSLLVAWVAFPLVSAAISLGSGLLLEQAAGRRLPGVLLFPAGLALVIVAAGFTTLWDTTAELTVPLVVALAVAGYALALPWPRRPVDWWAAGAALATFAAYAAPIVLSGSATFAGYITLDDTATWLALADRAMEHGRSLAGLAPSSYEVTLQDYMGTGYPLGAFLPLGIGHELVGQDTAWLFQPQVALLGSGTALGLYSLASGLVERRSLRALVAFVAAQPALLYGYAIWSGIKELTAVALIGLAVALAVWALTQRPRARDLVPPAVAVAALTTTLTLAGAVWLVGAAVGAVAIAGRRYGRAVAAPLGLFIAGTLALSVPAIVPAGGFFRHLFSSGALLRESELGNLIRPLKGLQLFGIWPAGDFRVSPDHELATYLLIGVVIGSGLLGLAWAMRSKSWALPLYVVTVGLGCAVFVARGSPWVDGKALVTASPAFVLAGMLGAVFVFQGGRLIASGVMAAAIAGGVLWSNALAYHQVWLAPRAQLHELETIGDDFAGQGPALMTEPVSYAVRHFLRNLDPEGASERRRRPVLLRNGTELEPSQFADIDDFALDGLLVYRTLVLRRSPSGSRPPSAYALVRDGRFYDVWQRSEQPPQILEHLPLGGGYEAGGAAPCAQVERLARTAEAAGGRLVAATSEPTVELDLSGASLPSSWQPVVGNPAQVVPGGSGTATGTLFVPVGGTYGVWLGGSFRDKVEVSVDGRPIESRRNDLNWTGQYSELGTVSLRPGTHGVTLQYSGPSLRPGSGGVQFQVGPLVLARTEPSQLLTVSPAAAGSLCGRRLDWVEAVAG